MAVDTGLVRANGHVWTLDLSGLRGAVELGIVSSRGGIDLSGVDFATPGGMVGLTCLIRTWAAEWGPVLIEPPTDGVAGYMLRMDFFKHHESITTLNRSLSHLNDRCRHPAPLSEIQRVRDMGGVTEVTKCFGDILLGAGVGEAEIQHCRHVLSESLLNVLEHAESPCGAFTAIQKYAGRDEVRVAVADAGLGIPHTICNFIQTQSAASMDHQLITAAMQLGVSSRPGVGRGGGLDRASRSVGDGGGWMKIWSNRGFVESWGVGRTKGRESAHAFCGTCVEAVFPLQNTRA